MSSYVTFLSSTGPIRARVVRYNKKTVVVEIPEGIRNSGKQKTIHIAKKQVEFK
jgi:hypothetical protein